MLADVLFKKGLLKVFFHTRKRSTLISILGYGLGAINFFFYPGYRNTNFIWVILSIIMLIYTFLYPIYWIKKWEKRIINTYGKTYIMLRCEFYEDHYCTINEDTNASLDISYEKITRIKESHSFITLASKYKEDNNCLFKKDFDDYEGAKAFLYQKIK